MYLGSVGNDKYAEILRSEADRAGLRVEYHVDADTPTGRCGVVISGHDRSLCTDLAAANLYKADHLRSPAIWSLVQNARYFFVGGYHLTVCPEAAQLLAEHAAEHNKVFALSLSAPFIPMVFKSQLDALEPYWDYVIGNEAEAAQWAVSQGLENADKLSLEEIAKIMALRPKKNTSRPRTVVITHGTEPTIVATSNADFTDAQVRTFPTRSIDAAEICDTNGAGDAFAGGFLAGLVQGKDLDAAVDIGQWLAALSLKELGPSFPYPRQTYTGRCCGSSA